MTDRLELHPDRLFSTDVRQREIARELYSSVADLPLVSPHGHTDPQWFADDVPFANPTALLVTPDHYVTRMLYSQGVPLESLGVSERGADGASVDPRESWRTFASHVHLFRGTPSGLWLDHVLSEIFGVEQRLSADAADAVYDHIDQCLADDAFRPRALLDRFRIEFLATTDSPIDDLEHHRRLVDDGYEGRVVPTFRPDAVTDPDRPDFLDAMERLGSLTGRDIGRWDDYLAALFERRQHAIEHGATATDHGHPTAMTATLDPATAQSLLNGAIAGTLDEADCEDFRAGLLVEMAAMSVEDGLVMQVHPGSRRNHNRPMYERFGADIGGDIPGRVDYVGGLRELLNRFGNDPRFRVVLFTLDESTFSRELAPLAGHYPAMYLGPPWWFLDSPEGMLRFRKLVTETAGFANTSGFIDDTRAFMSIPARHDVARRIDARFLAELVGDHRLTLDDAHDIITDLTDGLPRRVFNVASSG